MSQTKTEDAATLDRDIFSDDFSALPAIAEQTAGGIVQHYAAQERVFGAQAVAVRRDERLVLQKLKALGGAVGEEWYYRWPVNDKGKKKWIEGPSIKCANDVARIYGNDEIDVRVDDKNDLYWVFYARFIDYESGYALTRLFQQRKSQQSMRTDAERARDIAFQIGQSKAIRNVIVNALRTFADFALQAAKEALVSTVGRDLPKYRDKVAARLKELNVDLARVEAVRGRALADWLAPDVSMTIGEIKAVADGMAAANEMWPPLDQEGGKAPADLAGRLDQLAGVDDNADNPPGGEPDETDEDDSPKFEALEADLAAATDAATLDAVWAQWKPKFTDPSDMEVAMKAKALRKKQLKEAAKA